MKSGHANKGTGRPRKSPDQVKSKVIKLRVSPGEHDQVKRMAARLGRSMSDIVRDYLLMREGDNGEKSR